MKKIFLISAMITSLLAIAGPKSDLEKAVKLESEGKQQEVVKLLKTTKPVKGEEAEYERIQLYLGQTAATEAEAITYLKKASENKNSKTQAAIEANALLVDLAKTDAEKVKELEVLTKRLEDKNQRILATLAALYEKTNQTSKSNSIIALGEKTNKEEFNLLLALEFIAVNKGAKVNSFANKALKSPSNAVKSSVYYVLAQHEAINTGDLKKVDQYLKAAEQLDSKNVELLANIANLYTNVGDLKSSIAYYKKVEALEPKNVQVQFQIALLNAANGNVSESDKYVEKVKKEDKNIKNINIAVSFANNRLLDQAEKYAQKAVKDKAEGATEILKQIQQLKTNNKK